MARQRQNFIRSRLTPVVERSRPQANSLGCAIVDLPGAVDVPLRKVSDCIREITRADDVVVSTGRNTLFVFLPGIDQNGLDIFNGQFAKRLKRVDRPCVELITVQSGLSTWELPALDPI